MAIILNNEKHVLTVPDENRIVRLLSGATQVPDDVWMRVRAAIPERIGPTKSITEIGADVKKSGKEEVVTFKTLHELDPKVADEIVEKTLDVDTLETWKKNATRETLRLSLMNRIEEMKKR